MTRIRLTALVGALLLTACGDDQPLPPARPLTATAEQLAAIPGRKAGPHKVAIDALDWSVDGDTLKVRVVRPVGAGPFPLIVFSHGFASDVDEYDALLHHWASHGYLSIAPFHADGGGTLAAILASIRLGKGGLIASRVRDLSTVLDHLDTLEQAVPALHGRIDHQHTIAAGHSFGAFTAQQLGGADAVNPDGHERIRSRDPRIRAVVAISPPGEMFGWITAESWTGMETPMLLTTGTWDRDGRFVTDWRQHLLSFETAPAGQNWALVIEGADHYLGSLICRTDRDEPPQTDALAMVKAVSTTFMNAQAGSEPMQASVLQAGRLSELTERFAIVLHR